MNSIAYALMTYALTAVISLSVVGLIVFVNHFMGGNSHDEAAQELDS